MLGIRCVFFDTEIQARKCLDMQLTGKAICKMCEDGKTVKEALEKIKGNKKEKVMSAPKNKQCTSEGCEKFGVKDALCVTHYKEKYGESPYGSKKKEKTAGLDSRLRGNDKSEGGNLDMCSIEGCGNTAKSRGLCNKHYLQELKAGRIGKKTGKRPYTKQKNKDVPPPSATPPSRNDNETNNSLIFVDLKEFPKIHRYCTALDFVSPSDMLGVVLRKRLKELEEVIAI